MTMGSICDTKDIWEAEDDVQSKGVEVLSTP